MGVTDKRDVDHTDLLRTVPTVTVVNYQNNQRTTRPLEPAVAMRLGILAPLINPLSTPRSDVRPAQPTDQRHYLTNTR